MARTAMIGLLAAAALWAGCGGDGEAEQVRSVVEEVFTSNDPEVCRLLTEDLLDRTSERSGERALADCEEQVQQGEPPDSVAVDDVSVEGETATATFTTEGGELHGGGGEVTLLRQDERWRVDAVSFRAPEPGE